MTRRPRSRPCTRPLTSTRPTDPAAFVAAYNDARPRHAHGTHRYTAADFGLDERELRERFAFLDG